MRRALWIVLGLVGAIAVVGATSAAFTATTSTGPSTFSASGDMRPPAVSRSVVQKSASGNQRGTPGFIRPGGTYYLYAQAADDPASASPSGIASLAIDTSTLSASPTTFTSSGGPWTVAGQTYNYRSAQTTHSTPSGNGAVPYTLRATDGAGNAATSSTYNVMVDATVPTVTGLSAVNGTGVAGRPDAGDVVTITYSEPVDPDGMIPGWDGTGSKTIGVIINSSNAMIFGYDYDNSGGSPSASEQLPLGTITLNGSYYPGSITEFTSSSMTWSGSQIQVTLATPARTINTVAGAKNMSINPTCGFCGSRANSDRAGNVFANASYTETDNDVDF